MSRTGKAVGQVKGAGVEGDGRRFKSGIARILKGIAAVGAQVRPWQQARKARRDCCDKYFMAKLPGLDLP